MLRIHNLNKKFGKSVALDGLDLEIKKGELYGFVGPNGAGKTTTMKIISGLLKADSGEVFVGEIDAIKDNLLLKDKIGYMPDFFGVYDNLKVLEYMEFYASIYGLLGNEAKKLCYELLEVVNLKEKAEQYVDELSRGMKQRLCLARCLVHNPDLLILDEPASGLDPRARFEMKGILKNLIEMDKTILISSHILPELAQMCTNIGIIENGKMVLSGNVENIMANLIAGNSLVIRFESNQEAGIQVLKHNQKVSNISILGSKVSIGFNGTSSEEAALLTTLIQSGAGVSSYRREEGNLESLFMQITKEVEGGELF